jgi:2-polyprenyl-3-methyl-5-hydroxy-6-metoxy-1,4-benzoquinol methylase
MDNATAAPPNPGRVMQALNAYQQTYALKSALELDLFTHIGEGTVTAGAIASRAQASERGIRMLCDYLVVTGLLTKAGNTYGLTPDAAAFLDRRSPAYLGAGARFLANDAMIDSFRDLSDRVRRGGAPNAGTLAPNDPIWVEFARSMAPMVVLPAQLVAPLVTTPGQPVTVLDVAAGHGLFGILVAQHNPSAKIVALDWANVLEVARENAVRYGVAGRFTTIAGSAFDVDLGTGYDLVLLPNFLHHFDPPTNVRLLRRLRAAMRPGSKAATIEFVPDDDRVAPPLAASFALTMLGTTPSGDAFTFRELDAMFREAGFGESRMQPLDPSPHRLIVTNA